MRPICLTLMVSLSNHELVEAWGGKLPRRRVASPLETRAKFAPVHDQRRACHSDGMSKFAPGASFVVVAQKDGSFAVEVHEPRRFVPLRITGYASQAQAEAAMAGFAAAEPLERPRDPVAPAKPMSDVAAGKLEHAVED